MKKQAALLILVFLTGCASKQDIAKRNYEKNLRDATIHFFKIQSFCSCYKFSFKQNDITMLMAQEDLMGSFDMLQNPDILKTIDSLGRTEAEKIKPSDYADFEGKKRITMSCLEFYNSKRLDSIAKTKFTLLKSDELEYE
ncbi:MAG: hypothetical protein ACO1N9_01545 [Flavobacterium sp.]